MVGLLGRGEGGTVIVRALRLPAPKIATDGRAVQGSLIEIGIEVAGMAHPKAVAAARVRLGVVWWIASGFDQVVSFLSILFRCSYAPPHLLGSLVANLN